MRFVVAQIGARHGYAVPAILEKAGMLERFYTDMTADVGFGRWLMKCGPLMGFRRAAARLAARRVPASILPRTSTFARPCFWFACNRALCSPNPEDRFRQQLRWSRALGLAMVRRGFGNATHLYSMLGECGPLLAESNCRGLTVVTEIYILLSSERILKCENDLFPDWEPAPMDLHAVRREFPGEDELLARTDFAVCPSEAVRQDLEQNFGFPPGLSAVVPYGVDQSWFEAPSRPVAGRVLFVGTACLRKGIHYLAMAAEHLRARNRNYEFRIAGDVAPQIANHPDAKLLGFLGRLPRNELRQEYAGADIFVLPSLAEGSAEAAYEALAAGLPVVTTAAAGSVVRDGIDGRIVPESNPMALALAIEQIVENRPLRAKLSKSARWRALGYTLDRYSQRLLAALGRTAERSPEGSRVASAHGSQHQNRDASRSDA
jgi:glycosyltransferase involved in cell wall biosynthesis